MKRILVVGGGLIGARHVVSAAAHDKCILAGLVDPRQEVGAQYGSMTEVNGPVDGVIIATPTHLHAEQGRYAAQRGWDLLIEKPVASDLSQAGALAAAVSAAGVASLVGHHRRYHAPVQQLKKPYHGRTHRHSGLRQPHLGDAQARLLFRRQLAHPRRQPGNDQSGT